MVNALSSPAGFLSVIGIALGLAPLARGMVGQRRTARIGDTSTSTISAIAVGEVRVSGVVEAAELTLTSPLQSRTCVYYRAHVDEEEGRTSRTLLNDERAVGFRVRDPSGDVRTARRFRSSRSCRHRPTPPSMDAYPVPIAPVARPQSSVEVARELVQRIHTVGPSPSLLRLEGELRQGDSSARRLGQVIEGSPALAARVLRVANSAFYAPPTSVVSLNRAVVLLGNTLLRQLVLTSLIASRQSLGRSPRQALAVARLMGDAVRSAVVCRSLADAKRTVPPDDAFSAGLLHDLGHIYLIDGIGDPYAAHFIQSLGQCDGLERELELTGTTHQDVGAVFAAEWNLPPVIQEILYNHHAPRPGSLAAIVRASDWLVVQLNNTTGVDPTTVSEKVDESLGRIGLDGSGWAARVQAARASYGELLSLFDTLAA
jgi:HD-like signal output (HDOD) protein